MNSQLRQQQGVSLFEMVIVILLIGILASVVAPLVYRGISAAHRAYEIKALSSQGRVVLELMAQDIRNTRSNQASDLTLAANGVTVTDLNGQVVQFSLSGNALIRTIDGSNTTLAQNVSSLALSYYAISGAVTATVTAVHFVRIELVLNKDSETETFRTTVLLRNAT